MKKRCLELEEVMKELRGEQGVLVQEKSLKTIKAEIMHVPKKYCPDFGGKSSR